MDEHVSYPVQCTEVDSFSEVETLIKATVVSSRKSDDKLACTLVGAINLIKCKKNRKITVVRYNIIYILKWSQLVSMKNSIFMHVKICYVLPGRRCSSACWDS